MRVELGGPRVRRANPVKSETFTSFGEKRPPSASRLFWLRVGDVRDDRLVDSVIL
jgi:hypothetical protein